MAQAQTLNTRLNPQEPYAFDLLIADDDPNQTPLDISTWSFQFLMRDSNDNLIWNIQNSGFTRPETGVIFFSKTQAEVEALAVGFYTIQLLVTKSGIVDDEYINGVFER